MESHSLPGKIQVSAETAVLLKEGLKEAWLVPREGGIQAKGKGILDTFWVQPRRASRFTASVSTGGYSEESDLSV